MKKLIIGLTLVMLLLAIAVLAIACNPPDNIQMTVTIDGLEKGEEATLTLSLSPGIDPAGKPLFQQTIRSDGERSLTVEITTSLKDGYYLLLLEAPEKYFREPKGYLFAVNQSQIVNPVGRSIIFDLIPPSAQTFKPYRESEESTGISDDEITYMAEALISLSAPPTPTWPVVSGSLWGLDSDDLATVRLRTKSGWERFYLTRMGNGPWEVVIRKPHEGDFYTITAEAEGYKAQPASYIIRIKGLDTAYVVSDNETSEEALHLDFQFLPDES